MRIALSKIKQAITVIKQKKQITFLDITFFFRQFATLLSAGIPIIQCCEMLENSQQKIAMRLLIYMIKREMLAGHTLYFCLLQHPRHFDPLICQLIKIGEHTGKLDSMLTIIANDHENKMGLIKRIKQALFYPCLIIVAALFVTFTMFIFVIPRFAELFHDAQQDLPLLTIWIFYFSTQIKQYSWFIFFIIGFILSLSLFPTPYATLIKNRLRRFLSELPIINPCIRKIYLARFARNLAITFAAGIPIIDALKLTANARAPFEFDSVIARLRSKISSGLELHQAMAMSSFFPALMIQMVKIGEKTGMLEPMLTKLADFFEAEIDQLITKFTQILEPLIMVVLGVLIGGLVIGMYLPIFKLGNTL